MANLQEVVSFLDQELNIGEIPDYAGALNGLQIENGGTVTTVAAAVDASLPVFEKAAEAGADLLLVHHGMFWQGAQRVTGAVYRKMKMAMDHGLALYSAHIPLDVHPVFGNNALLAKALSMNDPEPFFDWKGVKLGLRQEMNLSRNELCDLVSGAVESPIHVCPGGSERVGMVGVITGGAGGEIAEIAANGIDTFITGEGPHWSYPLAEELGVNLLYAGHYATETFGVEALAKELEKRFLLDSQFSAHPTGL